MKEGLLNLSQPVYRKRGQFLGLSFPSGGGVMSMMHRQPEDTITSKSTTTEGSESTQGAQAAQNERKLPLLPNGRIQPYVDFSHFNREWAKAQAAAAGNGAAAAAVNGSNKH